MAGYLGPMENTSNTPVMMPRWRSVRGRRLLGRLLRGERQAMQMLMHLDVQHWERVWLRWVLRRNLNVRKESPRRQEAVAESLAGELDALRLRQAKRRTTLARDQRSFRGNERHLRL